MLIACKSCRRQYDVGGMKAGEQVRCRCGKPVTVPPGERREARMLHCSSCGGKLRELARSCEYCGCEIALHDRGMGPACPECFTRLPPRARFCTACGIEIRPEAIRATRASAACPRCSGDLVLLEHAAMCTTECAACGGVWLDAAFFERLVETRDTSALAGALGASRTASPRETRDTVKYIPCPVCRSLMNRKNFAGCSGVVIDWCKGHGFWFDPLEIEKVVAFVDAGGMDRARRREIEAARKEIARLEEQKKRLASAPSCHTPAGECLPDIFSVLGEVAGTLLDIE